MSPPQLPQDKVNHFIYGFMIFVVSSFFVNYYTAFAIVVVIAFSKELYDEFDYGGFDVVDFIYTIIPALILIIKQLI